MSSKLFYFSFIFIPRECVEMMKNFLLFSDTLYFSHFSNWTNRKFVLCFLFSLSSTFYVAPRLLVHSITIVFNLWHIFHGILFAPSENHFHRHKKPELLFHPFCESRDILEFSIVFFLTFHIKLLQSSKCSLRF